jgi:hypothetical protein
MKVHHILAEADYVVVSKGAGRNRTFNIVDPKTGAVVGSERIRGRADATAKNLTAKSKITSPKGPLVAEPKNLSSRLKAAGKSFSASTSTPSVAKGGAVPKADFDGRVEPSLDKNKLGGSTKALPWDVPDKSKFKTQKDFAQNKKATQVVADLKARNPLKKWISKSKLGPIASIILSVEQLTAWADEYTDIIILCVNEGKSPNGDPRLANVRIKIAEEIITSFIALGTQILAGGAIVNKLRTLTLLGAALPGAGWISAAITGALYIGTSIAIRVASEILVSREFMEPVVDFIMEDWFEAEVIDDLARYYARGIGKAVPKAESRIVNSKVIREAETAASISGAAKELVSGSSLIQQALKKAKEQGINKNNAADKLAGAIEDNATTEEAF